MTKSRFYALSFTWGLPMTLIGLAAMLILSAAGKRRERWGYCYHYIVGKGWGGVSLGFVIITSERPSTHTKNHEHGHALQNCKYGLAMPFIVCIPSFLRYWYRELRQRIGKPCATNYDAIWFEGEATAMGDAFMKDYNEVQK
jgi:hypothetical protein